MVNAFDEAQLISVSTAFLTFFGQPATGSQTIFSPNKNSVDIDIIRGSRKLAALVPRGMVSQSMGGLQKNLVTGKMSNFARKYPLILEAGNITGGELLDRLPGENAYSGTMTKQKRLRYKSTRIFEEMVRRSVRTFEYLAAQSILTGKQDAIFGTSDTNLQYDFRRNAANTITVSAAWSGGSGTIMADFDLACDKVRQNGKANPDMAVLGSTAMKSFIEDSTVQALADNRRFEFIRAGRDNPVPPRFQPFIDGGFIPQGSLRTPKGYNLWLFVYQDDYEYPVTGTLTPYMPVDKVLVCSSRARCDRFFGPDEKLPPTAAKAAFYRERFGIDISSAPPMPAKLRRASNVVDASMFMPDAYESTDGTRLVMEVASAPIFATTQTDAFAVLDTEP